MESSGTCSDLQAWCFWGGFVIVVKQQETKAGHNMNNRADILIMWIYSWEQILIFKKILFWIDLFYIMYMNKIQDGTLSLQYNSSVKGLLCQ